MSKTTTTATAPIDMDALPPAGGSYTRQPDGTLVLNAPEPEPAAAAAAPATPATTPNAQE